jgi:hypothetical protein
VIETGRGQNNESRDNECCRLQLQQINGQDENDGFAELHENSTSRDVKASKCLPMVMGKLMTDKLSVYA